MSKTFRVVNMGASPAAIPSFTGVVDAAEDRSDTQKTVNADDLDLSRIIAFDVAVFEDGTALDEHVQERTATATLVVGDLVDGERNLIVASAAAGAVTLTLPAASTVTADTEVWVYAANVDNALNVDDNAADTIDGGAGPVALAAVGDILKLKCDGATNWDNMDT